MSETLHIDRHLMVSNRALQVNAIKAGIVPYIRSSPLRIGDWVPWGWTWNLNGKKVTDDSVQTLGDKVGFGSISIRLMR